MKNRCVARHGAIPYTNQSLLSGTSWSYPHGVWDICIPVWNSPNTQQRLARFFLLPSTL